MRMYEKKAGINYLRTVNAETLMVFSFCYVILRNKCSLKNFVPFDQVKYGGATYTRMRLILE